jgi:hypothetical protein
MEKSLRNEEKFKIEQRLSPLVGDHKRVNGDMIIVVEIIAGRLMRETLKR